jgi:hypothetical protein
MKKGDKVMVYQDPVTCEKPEGEATVTRVLGETLWLDGKGRKTFDCMVRFKGDRCTYQRRVSESLTV